MPTYTFERLSDGKTVEQFHSMRCAPRIGQIVEIDGEACRRTVSLHVPLDEASRKFPKYPYRARSIARREHLPKSIQNDPSTKFTKDGTLIVRGAKHEARLCSILGMERA